MTSKTIIIKEWFISKWLLVLYKHFLISLVNVLHWTAIKSLFVTSCNLFMLFYQYTNLQSSDYVSCVNKLNVSCFFFQSICISKFRLISLYLYIYQDQVFIVRYNYVITAYWKCYSTCIVQHDCVLTSKSLPAWEENKGYHSPFFHAAWEQD